MPPAIKVESVGKQYLMGEASRLDRNIAQHVNRAIGAPVRRLLGKEAVHRERMDRDFWALRDISLEVQEGEVMGIIGANGAGKSTLLKMLARITPPTEGKITMRGLTGSLLEVGTGFHPELNGRENIFLNGSILGMRRREIMDRYDEIVEFSGIGKFIETPVKRYSSGMFIRLAFSVAAHLEPDILLIDEVLAVGDAEFQRKCLNKMESIAHSDGHTVVYVSHGLSSVRRICDRVAVIEGGRLVSEGTVDSMIADYMQRVEPVQHGGISEIHPDSARVGTGEALVKKVSLLNADDEPIDNVHFGEPFTVAMQVEAVTPVSTAAFLVGIATADGGRVLTASSIDGGRPSRQLVPGEPIEVRATMDSTLLPAEFVIDAAVLDPRGTTIDYVERALTFTALNVTLDGSPDNYPWDTVVGQVRPETSWAVSDAKGAAEGAEAPPLEQSPALGLTSD